MVMSQRRTALWLLAAAAILPTIFVQASPISEDLMCQVYTGISGFGIPKDQEDQIIKCGGAPTYGEILFPSLEIILNDVPAELKDNGVFYDFGSGTGRTVVQALNYPFKKVVGIELSKKRYDASMDVLHSLQQRGLIEKGRKVEFINKDFTQVAPKGATVIYMCSTCYSDELMDLLADKFSKLKPGMQVITLKAFPNPEKFGFELIKEYKLPMTWSKDTGGSPVHVYELKAKAKKEKPKKEVKTQKTEVKKVKEKKSKKTEKK